MSANFRLGFQKRDGILFIDPKGDFDGSSACELANLIHDQYDGKGNVVIDIQQLKHLCPFGCDTFKCRFRMCRVPADRLLIRGERGRAIAPKGCRIQERTDKKGHLCSGCCKNCRCAKAKG